MSRRKYLDTKQPKVKSIMGDFILIGIICLFAFILIVTQITNPFHRYRLKVQWMMSRKCTIFYLLETLRIFQCEQCFA